MSTPGSGGTQPPEHDPSQSSQPTGWGQQPPADQPYAGQQPTGQQPTAGQSAGDPYAGQQPAAGQPYAGQPYPGQQQPVAGQQWGTPQQPGQPAYGQPAGAQAFGEPQKPKRKWLPIVGGIVALLVVFGALSTFLGGGDPEVGDCIKQDGSTSFTTVDCDSSDAEYKIQGTDSDMTGDEFRAADDSELCTDVPSTTFVLWAGDDESEDGHVYCASDV